MKLLLEWRRQEVEVGSEIFWVAAAAFLDLVSMLTVWMQLLWTLRTFDVGPSLLQLYLDVALQAVQAEQVVAVAQQRKLAQGDRQQTQGTFADLKRPKKEAAMHEKCHIWPKRMQKSAQRWSKILTATSGDTGILGHDDLYILTFPQESGLLKPPHHFSIGSHNCSLQLGHSGSALQARAGTDVVLPGDGVTGAASGSAYCAAAAVRALSGGRAAAAGAASAMVRRCGGARGRREWRLQEWLCQ